MEKLSRGAASEFRAVLDRYAVIEKIEGAEGELLDPRTEGLLRLGQRLVEAPASHGNGTRILVDGAATYRAMIQAIETAKDHIHVEFYIFQPDETGTALRDRLARKARAGVQVRVLVDAAGSSALPGDFWAPLREAGGKAAVFHPIGEMLARFRRRDRIDFRNHRKIVVVDGRIGFTGGINVGREYLGLDPAHGKWRDTHVRIEGPAALGLQWTFAQDWLFAADERLEAERYFPDPGARAGDSIVQVIDSGPDRTWSPIGHFYTQTIALARERVWITNPYFIPGPALEEALVTAALRGVDVRLLLPRRGDRVLVALAGGSYYKTMLQAGARIFLYDRGFVHAKTMVVDSWVGTIGSANMDTRSFHLNFELNVFVYDTEFVNELAAQFRRDLGAASELSLSLEETRGLPLRLLRAGARLLAPVL
jgi:cardiolipin synthase